MHREQHSVRSLGGAPHGSDENLDSAIGKTALIDSSPGHALEREGRGRQADDELQHIQQEVRHAYLGKGKFQNRGVLDRKLDGANNMKTYLSGPDTAPTTSSFLASALVAGAELSAAALAPFTDGAGAALVGALSAGGKLIASTFGRDSVAPSAGLDPVKFADKYYVALTERWGASVNRLIDHMSNLDDAKQILRHMVQLCDEPRKVIVLQQNEILDAWVNALKAQKQDGGTRGLGDADLDASVAGRLHITGLKLHPQVRGGRPILDIGSLKAELVGVADNARALLLPRQIDQIHVARVISGSIPPAAPQPRLPPTQFSFGVLLDGKIATRNETSPVSKTAIASFGHGDFERGLAIIWRIIGSTTLEKLNIGSVGG